MPASRSFGSSRTPSRTDGGFSVLELMVALLLFSALGVAVWSALAGGQRLAARSIRLAADTSRLLQLEQQLRRAAARVRIPFWAPGPGAAQAEGSLQVPWLDGQPDRSLQLDWREGRLQVRAGEQEAGAAFGPFASVDCGVYSGGAGKAAGLQVSIRSQPESPPLVILAPFGGSPPAPATSPGAGP